MKRGNETCKTCSTKAITVGLCHNCYSRFHYRFSRDARANNITNRARRKNFRQSSLIKFIESAKEGNTHQPWGELSSRSQGQCLKCQDYQRTIKCRGLCNTCYIAYYRRIKAGEITWKQLERDTKEELDRVKELLNKGEKLNDTKL